MRRFTVTVIKKEPVSFAKKKEEKKKYNVLVRFKNPFSSKEYIYATFMFEGNSEINARYSAEVYLSYLLDMRFSRFEILEVKEVK